MPPCRLSAWVLLSALILSYVNTGGQALRRSDCGCVPHRFASLSPEAKLQPEAACRGRCIFRPITGHCNNLKYPEFGQSFTRFRRILPPDYCTTQGSSAIRCSTDGEPLPSARTVSLELFQNKPARPLDKFLTTTHMVVGQFIAHDFGRRQSVEEKDENGISKCGRDECGGPGTSKICFPIDVFLGDPDFEPTRCLRFLRSVSEPSPKHFQQEQFNEVTSYLDLHTIYGASLSESEPIKKRGFTAFFNTTSQFDLDLPGIKGKPLLPQTDGIECRGKTRVVKCFLAGDERVKEQSLIAIMHTVFLRQHNRLAHELYKLNGHCWTQDRIFLEARKINIATWQNIVYREYLPLFLSEANRKYWGLILNDFGHTQDYNPELDATTSNVFMTASFRFGHSQIPPVVPLAKPDFYIYKNASLSGVAFNNPTLLYNSMNEKVTPVDAMAFGMTSLSAEGADGFYNKQLTRSFDADKEDAPSRDLAALDINRGRDHGLPGYNEWRRWCGLSYASESFDEFVDIPHDIREQLAHLYHHVDDVDLFVGGMMETPHPGDLSGPTFACLNGDQYHRGRFGDRFWHEEKPNGFTRAQLQSVRKMTMARVMCDNLDNAIKMQPNVLAHPKSKAKQLFGDVSSPWDFDLVYKSKLGHDNELVYCYELPQIDLSLWKDLGCPTRDCRRPERGDFDAFRGTRFSKRRFG